jgi:hypothetical protein
MLSASVGKKRTLLQVGFALWLVCLQMCVLFCASAISHAATTRLKVYQQGLLNVESKDPEKMMFRVHAIRFAGNVWPSVQVKNRLSNNIKS